MISLRKDITPADEEVLSSLKMNYFEYSGLNEDAKVALKSEYRRPFVRNSIEESLMTGTSNISNKPKIKSLINKLKKR